MSTITGKIVSNLFPLWFDDSDSTIYLKSHYAKTVARRCGSRVINCQFRKSLLPALHIGAKEVCTFYDFPNLKLSTIEKKILHEDASIIFYIYVSHLHSLSTLFWQFISKIGHFIWLWKLNSSHLPKLKRRLLSTVMFHSG